MIYERMMAEARDQGSPPKMTPPELAECALVIAREYDRQGLTMTLRQLYYQLVARGLLSNGQKHYKRVVATLSKARLRNEWPIHLLEDRTRTVGITDATSEQIDVDEALALAAEQIKSMPRWNLTRAHWFDQPVVVSVWVEKEALAGVFSQICNQLGVGLFPCKGYPSISSLWQWLEGAARATTDDTDRECVVLYFGDHDPDGMEIPRSVVRNLNEALASGVIPGRCPEGWDHNARESYAEPLRFRFERMGLSLEQIEEFNPPPFPAKVTSSRFAGYVEEFEIDDAWELDALEPTVLRQLVREGRDRYWDPEIARSNRGLLQELRETMRERMTDPEWIASVFEGGA